ncbi:MAG: ABC transporter substrate-binding protein [Candidatus Wallbacteria bacterium]|nr:ABC transporter substrate-binding protein [Candidatus Wallbacteria bacterium]
MLFFRWVYNGDIVISRSSYSLIIFFLLLMFLNGCGPSGTPAGNLPASQASDNAPAYGDTLVIGTVSEPLTLNPLLATDVPTSRVMDRIFDGLLAQDSTFRLTGALAETWEVSAEGREIIFHLRHGICWHDGHPFDAGDVRFTYEQLVSPKEYSPKAGDFERILTLEVCDSFTVRVVYSEPNVRNLRCWLVNIVPQHVFSGNRQISDFNRQPVGTGPFIFSSWIPGEQIVLRRNRDYYAGSPFLDNIVFKIIPDSATNFVMLRRGDLDLLELSPDQFFQHGSDESVEKQFLLQRSASSGQTFLGYNLSNAPLNDSRLRQALTMAIDRERIIGEVLHGYGRLLSGPFNPGNWACDPSIEPIPYSPAGAMKLLKEAGFSDTDKDGKLEYQSRQFVLRILNKDGSEERRLAAELIGENLAAVGIESCREYVTWPDFMSKLRSGDFDSFMLSRTYPEDPDISRFWHSSKIPSRDGTGYNYSGLQNQELDELLDRGQKVQEESDRKTICYEIHRLFHREQFCTFLFAPEIIFAIDRRIHGIDFTGPAFFFRDPERWFVPSQMQKYKSAD